MAQAEYSDKNTSDFLDRFNELGVTVSQASEISGISRNTVYKILQRNKHVKETTISRFKLSLAQAGYYLDTQVNAGGVVGFPPRKNDRSANNAHKSTNESLTDLCFESNIIARELCEKFDEINGLLGDGQLPSDIKDFRNFLREARKLDLQISFLNELGKGI